MVSSKELGSGFHKWRRNELTKLVEPFFYTDKTVKEIAKEIDASRQAVTKVLYRWRKKTGVTLSSEEKRRHLSRSSMGSSGTRTGIILPAETVIKMRESRCGRPLTEIKKREIALGAKARLIIRNSNEPEVDLVLEENGAKPIRKRWPDKRFLEIVYAVCLCLKMSKIYGGEPEIKMSEVEYVYGQVDPKIFDRQRKRISAIENGIGVFVLPAKIMVKNVVMVLEELKTSR
ncbi:MAG: hypothetical protein ABH816_04025 [Candidatus Levyibacteriota bacterium]